MQNLSTISTEELTGGEISGRTLFYGNCVDIGRLKLLYCYESRLFDNSGPICSMGPLLLGASLIIGRHKGEISSLADQLGVCVSDDLLEPFKVISKPLVTTQNDLNLQFRGEFSVQENMHLGKKGAGICLVRNSYPGLYVGWTVNSASHFSLLRIMNSYPCNKDRLDSYFFSNLMFEALGYNQTLRESLLGLVKDNIEQGIFLHTLLQRELDVIGLPVNESLTTFTISN